MAGDRHPDRARPWRRPYGGVHPRRPLRILGDWLPDPIPHNGLTRCGVGGPHAQTTVPVPVAMIFLKAPALAVVKIMDLKLTPEQETQVADDLGDVLHFEGDDIAVS